MKLKRHPKNPILKPNPKNLWEAEAVFNGSVIKDKNIFHLVYRAISSVQEHRGINMNLATIGLAESKDGINFTNRRLLIEPVYDWEKFGCEDPRVTKINNRYFIFYTALSDYPHTPEGIKIGLAITKDFKDIEEKHPVTHFNSKAMALFPEKIGGKIAAVLTVNTDKPPAKIAIAFFDEEKQIWSKKYWDTWLFLVSDYILPLQRELNDHIEVGAPPIKTKKGWLLIYSYIKDYRILSPLFGVEAVLLDLKNPLKIISRTNKPFLVPEKDYELKGKTPNIVFPSGALLQNGKLNIYYGAADTSVCLATIDLKELLRELIPNKQVAVVLEDKDRPARLERFHANPIIQPNPNNEWEAQRTYNPAAIYEAGRVHIVYRAEDQQNTAVFGLAISNDGVHIDDSLEDPIYTPRANFERKIRPGPSGCEDPRIVKIGSRLYMCYTAHCGRMARVAFTSIKVNDFLKRRWNWTKPIIISPPDNFDKNSCVLPEKVRGKYMFFHRPDDENIWVDFVPDLKFSHNKRLAGKVLLRPREDKWDSGKIGIAGPPIKTKDGWLLIYHGLSSQDNKYRLGAALLSRENPDKVLYRLDYPILEPEMDYENRGLRPGTVFSCGAVVIKQRLFVYYGAADQVVCLASINLNKLLKEVKKYKIKNNSQWISPDLASFLGKS